MLVYLESLCNALSRRDHATILQLLTHPLAAALPEAVREEATSILNGSCGPHAAPVTTLRLFHQTRHLLGVCTDHSAQRVAADRSWRSRPRQMELPLTVMGESRANRSRTPTH